MTKLHPIAMALIAMAACSSNAVVPNASSDPQVPSSELRLESAMGCLLDTDCHDGLFCFQNRCAFECASDMPCASGERCSEHGRCLDMEMEAALTPPGDDLAWDPEDAAAVPGTLAAVSIVEPPPSVVEVGEGQPFVQVMIKTAEPVEGGAILYRVELENTTGTFPSQRATGETEFLFDIPTGAAGTLDEEPGVQRVTLVTSVGGFTLSLTPRIGVNGVYAGEIAIREFGGSALPIRFGLRVVPSDASFDTAAERYLLLPASEQDLFSPIPGGAVTSPSWVERPLEFDTDAGVWFARYAAPFEIPGDSQFSEGGGVLRGLRVEIAEVEGKRVFGALADRWQGLFAARTSDGVLTPASVMLSGQLIATRMTGLPAAAMTPISGTGAGTIPAVGAPIELTACPDAVFSNLVSGTLPASCAGITNADEFTLASSTAKATCALALADQALNAGASTAKQVVAFLDETVPNPGGLSFGEFLERCAALQGYCVPSPEILCSEKLIAHAYQTQSTELTEAGALLSAYQRVARESYLGRQLAAFQVDTSIRLEWLRTSEAPLFLASELKAYNEDLLNRWREQVLDAHFDVLRSQFAPSGLEVLGRQPTDPVALSVRGQMLLEQAQTWQGAMDALQIASSRWNTLFQGAVEREAAAAVVRTRTFDLYVSAAVLAQLNRAAGSSSTSSIFGSGFAALLRSLEALSLPFNDLVFMRDAEVVVSRSVDPSSSSQTLLNDREELARRAVLDAQESVDRVLQDAQTQQISAQVLTDRMVTQAEELRSELVQICGLPQGCTPNDFAARPECAVNTQPGKCGFVREASSGVYASLDAIAAQPSVSEAGQAVLAFRQAVLEHQIYQEEFRANQERAQIELEAAEAFAASVTKWDDQRRQVDGEIQALVDEILALGEQAFSVEIAGIKAIQSRRQAAYQVQREAVSRWANLRSAGVTSDMRRMTSINSYQQEAAWLTLAADTTDALGGILADGVPAITGVANDLYAPARFAINIVAFSVSAHMRTAQRSLETYAAAEQLSLEEARARRAAELEKLEDLADLDAQQTQLQLADMSGRLRLVQIEVQSAINSREALIDALRRNLELDLAHDRDLVDLRDRRDKVKLRLADSAGLQAQVLRGELVASRHLQEYMQVVQRAQLLQGRYAALAARLDNLEELIASPAVIFAFANRLARAESRVERSKTLLFDWLVALEYYAVRPFIDQRLAILLARNPSQLEAIANELVRLTNACGGIVNTAVAELSVRDDLLKVGFETEDGTPAERFRAVLDRGNVPIDTQVRYSTDERVGDLIRSRKVLAASFTIRLDDFANLPLTCNSKVASVDVKLVGADLGRARPTVSILYDGTSTLRSCQPNIDTLVASLDPGTTSFGSLTQLRTAGRSVSPLANIGDFGAADSANRGLEGLPLASTWTVLIDPEVGENRQIDWDQLEDIELKLTWAYQDVFPVGQCQ